MKETPFNLKMNKIVNFISNEKIPIFVVTKHSVKVLNIPYVTFPVDNTYLWIGVFEYKGQNYWFWYKALSKKRITIYAPGLRRKKYKPGASWILNKEIYNHDKPLFISHQWNNLKHLFKHGAMRIHFVPMLYIWESIGVKKLKVKQNKLYGITNQNNEILLVHSTGLDSFSTVKILNLSTEPINKNHKLLARKVNSYFLKVDILHQLRKLNLITEKMIQDHKCLWEEEHFVKNLAKLYNLLELYKAKNENFETILPTVFQGIKKKYIGGCKDENEKRNRTTKAKNNKDDERNNTTT